MESSCKLLQLQFPKISCDFSDGYSFYQKVKYLVHQVKNCLNSSSFHFSGNIHKSCTTFSQEYKLYTRKESKEAAFCVRESALSDRNNLCESVHNALHCARSQGEKKMDDKVQEAATNSILAYSGYSGQQKRAQVT
jgi:hypothetical protein